MVIVKYGFHGRMRNVNELQGTLIEETDKWLIIKVDNKKHNIAIDKILEYYEV